MTLLLGPGAELCSAGWRFARFIIFLVLCIIGGAAGYWSNEAWNASFPASRWFVVRSISIADVNVGEPVVMNVDRSIKEPFRARWIATVRRAVPTGLEEVCIGRGENDYSPAAAMPTAVTLEWWLGRACPLTPGQYKVDTLWTIDLWPQDRDVRVTSNLFRVN